MKTEDDDEDEDEHDYEAALSGPGIPRKEAISLVRARPSLSNALEKRKKHVGAWFSACKLMQYDQTKAVFPARRSNDSAETLRVSYLLSDTAKDSKQYDFLIKRSFLSIVTCVRPRASQIPRGKLRNAIEKRAVNTKFKKMTVM
jgi:hypothetical protein